MSKGKILGICAVVLLFVVILINWPANTSQSKIAFPEEVALDAEPVEEFAVEECPLPIEPVQQLESKTLIPLSDDSLLPPDVDRMAQLFTPYPPVLPIVETISYSGRVPWVSGRPAYLGDYASHYQTSKHFISRSLHGMGNYLSDIVSKGDRFNVLRIDKEIEFHLVLDLARLKMWLFSFDKSENQRVLLKSYPVCAGRLDSHRVSGSLTPLGTFSLGSEIAVYKPGTLGTYKNELKEMITIFGNRWIPIDREIVNCTGSCKGLGIHGVPWRYNSQDGELSENRECIGTYESNGCIRMYTEDIEELFALIVSRPSFIHIVRDFSEAKLSGEEVL